MSRRFLRGLVTASLLGVTLTGCRTTAEPVGAPTSPSPGADQAPASSPTPTAADARRALDRRVAAMLGQRSLAFERTIMVQGQNLIVIKGTADLRGHDYDSRMQAFDPESDHTYLTLMRVVDKHGYMQMPEWKPPWHGCWLDFESDDFPGQGTLAAILGFPSEVQLLESLQATRLGDSDRVEATVPYVAVASLAPGKLRQDLLIDGASTLKIPVVVMMSGDRVASVRVEGAKVRVALTTLGDAATPDLIQELDNIVWEVRYPVGGAAHAIKAPDPELLMTATTKPDEGCR